MASAIASESYRTGNELKLCGACTRDSQTIPAIKWCRDCREGLCEPCYTYHKKHKTSANHDIISIDAVTKKELFASKLDIERCCKSHNNEPLKLYCKNHKSFCCTLCAFSTHRKCNDLIPLDDIAKLCEDQKLLQKQTTAFKETKTKVQNAIDKKSAGLQNLDRDKSSILSRASDTLRKAKDKLDQLYRDFERNVNAKHKQIKQSQDKMMSNLLEFQKEVERNTAIFQSLQHVTPVETLIMMETLKANIVQHYENMADELKQDSNVHITCKLDTSMTTLLDNLSSIGELVKESYGADPSEDVFSINKIKAGLDIGMLIGSPAQYPPVLSKKDLMTARVTFVKAITREDLNLNGDVWFTDGKFLHQGHLLLADWRGNRLVLLNENMQIMTEIKVNARPSCVDISIDGKEVTVVCDQKSVHHYSLPGGQEIERRMTVENEAWGLAITGDTTVIGHRLNSVALYDKKGNEIKSRATGIDYPYIAVSNNREQFFYCKDGDTVVTCDKTFNVTWRYKCDDLKFPCGICVDSYDNVYVVDCTSQNIHQISGDGTRHRVLLDLKNGTHMPWAIAFHRTKDMFVVTFHEPNGPFEMYEFSS